MNKKNNKLWKLCLILLVLFSWTTESNAQFVQTAANQSKILAPIVKIVSDVILNGKSKIPNMEPEVTIEKSYFNSSLFFFEENIQVCKDILAGNNDSIDVVNISSQTKEQILIEKDTVLTKEETKIIKKKIHKSIWNNPGNTKSRI
ncbi:hypothetical protein [Labilibaculum sp.]|uniref:hypothetical protein n=1 Tax=Labilibaculum sp. TaxID=2060723 RepID=UPI002AA84B0D|nr:hypothetical protein [Labilibaculum sp.]MBN2596218.1 hypothetical protein [Marinifilaceae bacterium]